MSGNLLQNIYEKSPNIVQIVALNLYALRIHRERYGKEFFKVYEKLLQSQFFTKEEIVEYQNQALEKVVSHAYNTTGYYRDLFDRYKLKPNNIQSKEDLHKIPVLTKDLIRENFNQLISSDFKKMD